jgi:UDP-glucose 4-epimerase
MRTLPIHRNSPDIEASRTMARIVVTGGAGFVGLPLCRKLNALGHDVWAIDNLIFGVHKGAQLDGAARLIKADIGARNEVAAALGEIAPSSVVHLAALHFVPECNLRPVDAVRINILGTQSVLDSCRNISTIERIVVTSSAAVYPISDQYFTEAQGVGPTDIYGTTKAANEWQAARFSAETGVRTAVVRLFNVFGPGETNPHVIPEIVEQLKRGSTELRLGNVASRRCYVYVDDVVDGYVALLRAELPHGSTVVNLGTREEASVEEIVDIMSSLLRREIRIAYDAGHGRLSDRTFLRCDPTRMRDLTGWQAQHTLRAGLDCLLRREGLL